jgi:nitroreductase
MSNLNLHAPARGMTVSEAIRTKHAVRTFTDQPVPPEVVRAILNAGRRSQSSKNSQPWQFIVITEQSTLKQLAQCGRYAGHLAGAAFAVALVAPPGNAFDLGQAAAYLQLAAWEYGIGSCIASMHESERAKAILGVPHELAFEIAISFGYPAKERLAAPRRGGRKPFDEVVRWEKW